MHGPHTGWPIRAPSMKRIVIRPPLDPEPRATTVDVMVPQRATVAPGPIALPVPQFDEALRKETAFAFAQLRPFPDPADAWAMKRVGEPPLGRPPTALDGASTTSSS